MNKLTATIVTDFLKFTRLRNPANGAGATTRLAFDDAIHNLQLGQHPTNSPIGIIGPIRSTFPIIAIGSNAAF